ncbi:hypothetical protein U0070_020486, partial [Myodes glareolus]
SFKKHRASKVISEIFYIINFILYEIQKLLIIVSNATQSVIEKTDVLAYEESLANQEESMHAGSDIFTPESLGDNISDDSENIQLLV